MRVTWIAMSAALVGCGAPDFETELRPEGPPEVTLVNVASESADEAATYCGAPKRNLIYCPEEGSVEAVADAPPLGLFVRIAFDELLDPSIESLDAEAGIGILADGAVTLSCGGAAVAVEGFYQPSGSHLTDPPGPALVVSPAEAIAAGSSCTVEVGAAVSDKGGNAVPADDRGPYAFDLAALRITGTNPQDMTEGIDIDAVPAIGFNNLIDETTLAGAITVSDGGPVAVTLSVDPESPDTVLITPPGGEFAPDTTYTVTVTSGITDVAGAPYVPENGMFTFSFTTGN